MAAPTRTEVIAQAAAAAALKAQAGSAAGLSVGGVNLNTPPAKPKVTAKFWVNVGYSVPAGIDPITGLEMEETFVSLPFGIPLDLMEPAKVPAGDTPFAKLRMRQNKLLSDLLEHAAKVTPGTAIPLSLELQIRHNAPVVTQDMAADDRYARTKPF